MTSIKINGKEQELSNGGMIFGELIQDITKKLGESSQVISVIKVDGKELSEVEEKALAKRSINEIGIVEFETSNPIDLAFQTLNTLETYLDRLSLSISKAAQHYRSKSHVTGDTYFSRAIDGLDLFIQTISGIKLALKVGLNSKLGLVEADLIGIMTDVLEAKRQNNYLYIADLLENDLIRNLQDWKSEVFPVFRSCKTS